MYYVYQWCTPRWLSSYEFKMIITYHITTGEYKNVFVLTGWGNVTTAVNHLHSLEIKFACDYKNRVAMAWCQSKSKWGILYKANGFVISSCWTQNDAAASTITIIINKAIIISHWLLITGNLGLELSVGPFFLYTLTGIYLILALNNVQLCALK